jgi:hypothetical protein
MNTLSVNVTSSDPKSGNTLSDNLANLRSKLKDFIVLDMQGQRIGEIRDLALDVRQRLNLVVAYLDAHQRERRVLLATKLIRKVGSAIRTVFVDITQADVSYLPEYKPQDYANVEANVPPAPLAMAIQPLVNQLPATRHEIPETADIAVHGAILDPDQSHQYLWGYPSMQEMVPVEKGNGSTETPAIATSAAETHQTSDQPTVAVAASTSVVSSSSDNAPALVAADHVDRTTDDTAMTVPLLEERVLVNYTRQKAGEVIVRKQIETRMVQVPVRYEKLIIEQISPERKQLAEVDLSQGESPNLEGVTDRPIVYGEFRSPRVASQILDAIAKTLHHHCKTIRIEIELDDDTLQETYQTWLNRYSRY